MSEEMADVERPAPSARAAHDAVARMLQGALLDTALHRHVVRGLRRYFDDHHQPITRATLGSAAKRITENIRNAVVCAADEMEAGDGV